MSTAEPPAVTFLKARYYKLAYEENRRRSPSAKLTAEVNHIERRIREMLAAGAPPQPDDSAPSTVCYLSL